MNLTAVRNIWGFVTALIGLLNPIADLSAQNETSKWYFGNQAGLDFMTNPPTILTNGAMNTIEGCASIADGSGNLLFYTDGVTVYNSQHATMSNGTGLLGSSTPCQSAIIIRRPGSSTLYYIFTMQGISGSAGLNYSVVDMSLSSGQGSVTTKNSPLYNSGCYEKITATKHCNGIDYWVLIHEIGTSNFRAYLLTSAGAGTTAVISSIGSAIGLPYSLGCMKLSPSGRKLGMTEYTGTVDLFDFDNGTGIVSNSLTLATSFPSYGCEFSPDGTKFYAGGFGGPLRQWDVCAGSNTAIIASQYTVSTSGIWSMQLASNGKIYCAKSSTLGVINSPNLAGSLCNYVDAGQSISPKSTIRSIPNFVGTGFSQPPPSLPFTFSVSNAFGCQTASFNAPPSVSTITNIGCSSVGYSLTGVLWNFGDPASGSLNTSTLSNPLHAFTSLGTHTVQLIRYFTCGSANDTSTQLVNINQPCIVVNSTSITCASLGSATVSATGGIGPFSYTWMPSAQSGSVASGLSPGTYTLTVFDFGNNFTYTATTTFNSLIPLTGSVSVTPSVSCNSANTGTGAVTNLAGGSGNQFYWWNNGLVSHTTAYTSSLSAGIWSITVTDALTGCTIKQTFFISQPSALNTQVTTLTPTVCAGKTASLSATASGATPFMTGNPYVYTWVGGPSAQTYSPSQATGGSYVYTVNVSDSLNCVKSGTVMVGYVNNPVISVAQVSVCPQKSGTLTATGASSYTWGTAFTGSIYIDNPLQTTVYTLTGSALGCTATGSGTIFLYTSPTPFLQSNSPVCNGLSLQFNGSGGNSYVWNGPLGFSSTSGNPAVSPASPAHSGVYNMTVTSVEGCTASISQTVVVNPTPTLSASGSTVCTTGTLVLAAQSVTNAGFLWRGPLLYTSTAQDPAIPFPSLSRGGTYTVVATSAQGCTNSAVAQVSVTAPPVLISGSNGPKCAGSAIQFSCNVGETFLWTGPNGFSSTLQFPSLVSAQAAASGNYSTTITWGPCSVTTTLDLVIFPLPVVTAASNGTVCETKKINLSGTTSQTVVSYQWQGPANFNSKGSLAQRDSSKLQYSGVYKLTVIDKNGCSQFDTTRVKVEQNPLVTASGATVCLLQPAVLHAQGAAAYFWQGPVYFQASLQSPTVQSVNYAQAGEYTVTGTAINGCTAVARAWVKEIELPIPFAEVLPSSEICEGNEITLKGKGGTKYYWSGPLSFQRNEKEVSFKPMALGSGVYTLIVEDEIGCRNYTVVTLNILPLPQGQLSGKFEGCEPLCTDFIFTSSDPSVVATWDVNGFQTTEKMFSYCFDRAGTYTLKGSLLNTSDGCGNKFEKDVVVYSKPIASFKSTPELPVESREEVLFTNTSEGEGQVIWEWHLRSSDQNYTTSGEHMQFIFPVSGSYPVALVVENNRGCVDTVVKEIKVLADFNVFVPNAFTPNGDGENDRFNVSATGIRIFKLRMFDRWGEEVFYSKDLQTGWDGTYKGVACPEAVYTYLMEITSADGKHKITSGHVSLIR